MPESNHETWNEQIRLLTEESRTVRQSLKSFDNHDPRIPYYELVLEQDLSEVREIPLPPGYHYENYAPGDKSVWIAIEKTAREFSSDDEGEAAWERYFAGHEKELETRMFFVADASGCKLATATAFYDIRTGDDGQNGVLHWVSVRRDAQGRGLSKPLISHTLCSMRKMGYRRAVVPTQTTTWLACKVYLDLGFTPISRNAERNRTGWRIIRTLTDHPALERFEPVGKTELIRHDLKYITLRERPDLMNQAAAWFHQKWGVPQTAYLECMEAYLKKETEYGWYLCLDGEQILGGLGVIENDFHDRKDLAPNVCAVYTEASYRGMGIAGRLLSLVVEDMRSKGVSPLYLVTDHTGFYEQYGWEFLCMVQGDEEDHPARMYVHR